MVDLGALASSAIGVVGPYLLDTGKDVVSDAAKAAGRKMLDWLTAKLTDDGDKAALAKLGADPQSAGARRMLEGALLGRLEADGTLATELADLLKELGAGDRSVTQTMTQTGSGNVGSQIAGDNNRIDIGRRD